MRLLRKLWNVMVYATWTACRHEWKEHVHWHGTWYCEKRGVVK